MKVGQRVRTIKEARPKGQENVLRNDCQWGVLGEITATSNSHGEIYEVRHPDGTKAWYETHELVRAIR